MKISRVNPGEPLRIPAGAYNAFADAAEDFARRGLGNGGDGGSGGVTPALTVRVRNDTGGQLAAFACAAANFSLAEVQTLAANERGVGRRPVVSLAAPAVGDATPFLVVLPEPVPEDDIGDGVVAGVCVATVNVTDLAHRYADLSGGVLVSQTAGRVRLLQAATADTGEQPCLVNLSQTAGAGGGSGGVCPVGYALRLQDWDTICTAFDQSLTQGKRYLIEPVGCAPGAFGEIHASGRVVDADGNPVPGVDIQGNTAGLNATVVTGTVGTTDADGYWSGTGTLEVVTDEGPIPFIALRFSAAGYTPDPAEYQNPVSDPLTGVNFAP